MSYLWRFFELLVTPIRAILSAPVRLVSAPRRFWGLTLPARVASILALFLFTVIVIDFCLWLRLDERADIGHMLRVVAGESGLAAVICVTVYWLVRLWLQGRPSPFPDIEAAWKQGMDELDRRGVDVTNLPVFLVLGASGSADAATLMRASALTYPIADVPAGDAPLKWFVAERGIFLVCTGASYVSRVARSAPDAFATPIGSPAPPRFSPDTLRGTMVAGEQGFPSSVEAAATPAPASTPSRRPPELYATMVVGGPDDGGSDARSAAARSTPVARKIDTAGEAERLRYVCDLLRRAREPVCPLNGVLAVMPFGLIQSGAREAHELQLALRQDLAVVRDSSQIRCPVVALVTGMESQSGFRALLRRVGADNARTKRFGKGYNVWNPPTTEQIEAVGKHACAAFEDWVYKLFGETGGYNKPDNPQLYALLCRIRSELSSRLTNILANSFGEDPPDRGRKFESVLFGGCYFAATGGTEDRQGFVQSVFERLLAEESELEWLPAALQHDARCQRLALLSMLACGVLLTAFVGLLAWKLWA